MWHHVYVFVIDRILYINALLELCFPRSHWTGHSLPGYAVSRLKSDAACGTQLACYLNWISPPDATHLQHFPSEPPSSSCFQLTVSLSPAAFSSAGQQKDGHTSFPSSMPSSSAMGSFLNPRQYRLSPSAVAGNKGRRWDWLVCLPSVHLHTPSLLFALWFPCSSRELHR